MSENIDDMTKDKEKKAGSGGAKKAASGAKKAAKTAQKLKKAGIAVKLIGALWWIAFIIVFIFLVIGLYSFIITLPGMMLDKISETVGGFWDSLSSLFCGNEVYIKDRDQTELANYINNMGYDVIGYGFASSNDIKLANKDKEGDTEEEEVTSQYLKAYLLADYNTYAIDTKSIASKIGTFFGELFGNKVLKGMLVLEQEEGWSFETTQIDRKSKTITFEVWNPELTDWFKRDTYTFDLDGWAGRYGKPLEFLLTLHISTMAPDLAYRIASDEELDTKVHIGFETVDAWITTRYVVKDTTVDELKKLDKDEEQKEKVIWNIEGLEDLKNKIADDGTLELDKEALDKIQEVLDDKPDEYEYLREGIKQLEAATAFMQKSEQATRDGNEGYDDTFDQMYNLFTNSGQGEWINTWYDNSADMNQSPHSLAMNMDTEITNAKEENEKVKFIHDDGSYYETEITDIGNIIEFDSVLSLGREVIDAYLECEEEGLSESEKAKKEETLKEKRKAFNEYMNPKLVEVVERLEKMKDDISGYEDEDGNHVDGDIETLNKNSEEAQNLRNKLQNALLEIGLTPEAIEEASKMNKPKGGTSIKAVQPHINYVSKAWYRNIYFVINDTILNAPDVQDDEYIKNLKEKKANGEDVSFSAYVTKEDTKVPLPDYVFEPGEGTEQEDMKGIDGKGEFLISEMRNSSTTQTEQPKKGEINKHTKELFVGSGNNDKNGTNPKPEYYIYDGSQETAKKIDSLKEKVKSEEITDINSVDTDDVYREINMNKNSLAAFSILENMKTQDADFILRDLKDLLVELKYFKKSDLEDKDVGVLDWIMPAYIPQKWPESQFEKQNYQYGTYIKYRENILQGSSRDSADLDILKISDTEAWETLTNGTLSARPTEYEPSNRSQIQEAVKKKIVPITVKIRTWSGSGLEKTDKEIQIEVNEELKEVWECFFEDIYNEATDFVISEYGGYRIDGTGTGQVGAKSAHEYGAAVDLNWSQNAYGVQPLTKAQWDNLSESKAKYETIYIGSKVVEIAHKYTLSWGGDWTSCKDNMHFSFFGDESRDSLIQKWGNGITVNRGASNAKAVKSMDQVLIIGDQMVKGLKDSGQLSDSTIEAEANSTPATWLGKVDSLPTEDIKGVTVLLGGNAPSQIEEMKQLISKLAEKYSSGQIFVQKVFHVAEKYSGAETKNTEIDSFNKAIEEYCDGQENVTYIDTTRGLINSKGFLVDKITDDGYALNSDGYEPWAVNIKNKVLGSVMYAGEKIDFEDQDIITPGAGKVIEVSDKSITIEFTQNNIVKGMTMKISGIDVDDNIKAGDELEVEQNIGKSLKEDILLLLRTENKSVLENVEDYMPSPEYNIESDEDMISGFVENPPGEGVERWRDIVISALAELGLDTSEDTVQRVLGQITNESGGDPYAVNDYDSNSSFDCSVGVLQAISSCYNTYKRPEDPPATAFTGAQYRAGDYDKNDPRFCGYYCIYACINYCAQRYGRDLPVWPGGGY